VLSEDFHSGDDIELAFLGRTYSFARADFEERVLRAAVELDLATRPLSRRTRRDLIEAAVSGEVADPCSETGERISDLLEAGEEDPVYWLRKLVFRSAWLDHRIKNGLVDVAFDEATGAFRIEPGRFPLPDETAPSFAVAAQPEDRA
jgi:hypothetical protein